jgi:hypothetical protein
LADHYVRNIMVGNPGVPSANDTAVAVTGVASKKSAATFLAYNGTFIEVARTVGFLSTPT